MSGLDPVERKLIDTRSDSRSEAHLERSERRSRGQTPKGTRRDESGKPSHLRKFGKPSPSPLDKSERHTVQEDGERPIAREHLLERSDRSRVNHKVGRYEILDQLGRGGFGAVYRAKDPQLQRTVALKILMRASIKARQRFEREIQAVARLRHPHVVAVHDSGEEGGRPYLVMEFVEGQTLEPLIKSGKLDVRERARIVRDVARAIEYAHRQGVLHRDLKPENVLVDERNEPHVLDFGLAYLEEESGLQHLSVSGIPIGTPAFMAPEQASGRRPDQRTDVWGLGGLLYFSLTGEGPYERHGNPIIAIQSEPIVPPRQRDPTAPAALEKICLRCLSRNPDDRYASAGDLAKALDDYLQGRSGSSWSGQAILPVLVAALALIAGLTAFAVARNQRAHTSPVASPSASPDPASATQPPTPTLAPSLTPTTSSPDPAQASGVHHALDLAAELGRDMVSGDLIVAQLRQAASLAADDRWLSDEVALALARHYLRRGQAGLVRETLEVRGWQTRSLEADALRVELALLDGDEEDITRCLERLAQRSPDSAPGLRARAWTSLFQARQVREVAAAEELGQRALELDPDDVGTLMLLARVFMVLSQEDRALEHLDRAREVTPDDHRIHLFRAQALMGLERAEEAVHSFGEVIHLTKDEPSADAFAMRGYLRLSFLKQVKKGLRDLERAIELDPTGFVARLHRGLYRYERGQHEAALEDLRVARESNPRVFQLTIEGLPTQQRTEIHAALGIGSGPHGVSEAAQTWLDERVEAAPLAAQKPLRLALEAAASGRPWREVAPEIRSARAAAPESKVVALESARLACHRDAYEDSSRALARARALGAAEAEVRLLEAELLARRGFYREAEESFRALAASQGETRIGLSAQASYYLLQKDPRQTLLAAQAALELDPHLTECIVAEVLSLLALGQSDLARRRAEAGVEAHALVDGRLALARYRTWLAELGQSFNQGAKIPEQTVQQVLDEFETLRSLSEGASHLVIVAAFSISHPSIPGLGTLAERHLAEALEREPNRPGLHMELARLAVRNRNRKSALEHIRRDIELGGVQHDRVKVEFAAAFGSAAEVEALLRKR